MTRASRSACIAAAGAMLALVAHPPSAGARPPALSASTRTTTAASPARSRQPASPADLRRDGATLHSPAVPAAIHQRYLVLRTAAGGVVIQTNPFRYTVVDPSGRNVLAAAPNVLTSSTAMYSIAAPAPSQTASPETTGYVYTPLDYTTGTSSITAMTNGVWEGNLVMGTQAGTTYEATGVISETHTANSARLVLATNETAERHVLLSIAPDVHGFRFTATFDHADTVVGMDAAFLSPAGEAFHGFGGRHEALDQRGQSVPNYTMEECQNPAYVAGQSSTVNSNYLFPNGPLCSYNVTNAFVSNVGYGFDLHRLELSEYRLDLDKPNAWHVGAYAAGLDYSIEIGTPPVAIAALTSLTGRQLAPPPWAVLADIDRGYGLTESSASAYFTSVETDIANFQTYKPPISSYRLEGWVPLTPAQVTTIAGQLHALNIRMLVYLNPIAGYGLTPVTMAQADAGGYEAKTSTGLPYVLVSPNVKASVLLDFTNPGTVTLWKSLVAQALDTGADGFMEDFGEQVLPDMAFANGETGLTMHNEYPALYSKVTRDAIDSYVASHPGRQIFDFTRADDDGSAGYEQGNFPGDETADWGPASGLQSLAPDMLNRSVGGYWGYSTDIGGYFDTTGNPSKELYVRWMEWSALTPFFRLHNGAYTGTLMPWDVDADTVAKFNALAALHNSFAPMIQRLWQQANATGVPIVRPFWYEYPSDPVAVRQTQEWLLGPDVLVAPVVTQGAVTNTLYLPEGCWQDQNTKRIYAGRRTVTVAAPLGTVPYFFHCRSNPK